MYLAELVGGMGGERKPRGGGGIWFISTSRGIKGVRVVGSLNHTKAHPWGGVRK